MRCLLEAPSSWVIVGYLISPLHSPLCFSCLFPGLISVASNLSFSVLEVLTPEGSNLCLAAAELTQDTFCFLEAVEQCSSEPAVVRIVLFKAPCAVPFAFSLWIPFKVNKLLLFGRSASQKCSDLRITLW